jgi:MFS family permease
VYGWDSADYGMVTSAYGWFNVFFVMLIIVGILLDRLGIRFSTIASVLIMIIGGTIKWAAFKGLLPTDDIIFGLNSQVFFAAIGYAMFGVGVEYAGITVSKSVVKWFNGKELALAMGMQVAIARLGSFAPLAFGAAVATKYSVPTYILIAVVFLILGLLGFLYYNIKDKQLDMQIKLNLDSDEDKFKLKDLGLIISNRGFWYIALLCVLFYSAVFPFYKYGPDLMVNKFGVSEKWAGLLPSFVPFGTMLLTPFFGSIYDKKGKGASIMILGAVLLIFVHIIFYLPFITSVVAAFFNVIVLGIAFSLVPSAMWPSVPKIIPDKQLGSAYALIFWVQNFGLWGIPLAVGVVLDRTNPGVAAAKAAGGNVTYNYQTTWMIFVALTFLALIVSLLLKAEDKRKGYGLELPNIKE